MDDFYSNMYVQVCTNSNIRDCILYNNACKLNAHNGEAELLEGSTTAYAAGEEVRQHGLCREALQLYGVVVQELLDREESDVDEATTCVDGRTTPKVDHSDGADVVLKHCPWSVDGHTEEFEETSSDQDEIGIIGHANELCFSSGRGCYDLLFSGLPDYGRAVDSECYQCTFVTLSISVGCVSYVDVQMWLHVSYFDSNANIGFGCEVSNDVAQIKYVDRAWILTPSLKVG